MIPMPSRSGSVPARTMMRRSRGETVARLATIQLMPTWVRKCVADSTRLLRGRPQPLHQIVVRRSRDDAVELDAVVVDQADRLDPDVLHAPARAARGSDHVVHVDRAVLLGEDLRLHRG